MYDEAWKREISMNYEDIHSPVADEWVGAEQRKNVCVKGQGRVHGNLVAEGWAGAVMWKPLAIQKCDGLTDGPTDRYGKV